MTSHNVYKQRFQELIRCTTAAKKKDFNMEYFFDDCGTPGCILGNFAAAHPRTQLAASIKTLTGVVFEQASLYFGLDRAYSGLGRHFEAVELFAEDGCGGAKTPAQAVAYLRKFWQKKHGEKL